MFIQPDIGQSGSKRRDNYPDNYDHVAVLRSSATVFGDCVRVLAHAVCSCSGNTFEALVAMDLDRPTRNPSGCDRDNGRLWRRLGRDWQTEQSERHTCRHLHNCRDWFVREHQPHAEPHTSGELMSGPHRAVAGFDINVSTRTKLKQPKKARSRGVSLGRVSKLTGL